jgi:hypothetical protein
VKADLVNGIHERERNLRRDWKDDARAAIARLETVPHGEREREMHLIALQLRGHKDTTSLRRSIFAYEFWRGQAESEPLVHSYLADAPLSVVEVIARWHAFDPEGARNAAKAWSKGDGTVRSITEEMHSRRPKGFFGKTGTAYVREYATAAEPAVAEALRRVIGAPFSIVEKDTKAPSGISQDFVVITKERPPRRIAVLIVGPYNNPKNYVTKCADWIARAYGLAWLYDTVVLAVPKGDALPDYDSRNRAMSEKIAESKGAGGRIPLVSVISLHVDPFSEKDHAALSGLS